MEHAGVPISIISKWAGHYDSAFTQKTYVHASDEDLQRGQAALAKITRSHSAVRKCEMAGAKTKTKGLAHSREQGSDLQILSALGGTRTPNLLIRRSGQVVQDRPSSVVGWVDIPGLSACYVIQGHLAHIP
jgi:hypothetical protein